MSAVFRRMAVHGAGGRCARGAWALYEAWVKLLTGEADTALVHSYGKSWPGRLRDVMTRRLDPYYLAPLWPDSVALAALQAQALIDAGDTDEAALAAVAGRNRTAAVANPYAQERGDRPQGEYVVRPLRRGDCPPVLFAPHVRAYMRRTGAPDTVGALVAYKDRRNALRNPYAHLHEKDITLWRRCAPLPCSGTRSATPRRAPRPTVPARWCSPTRRAGARPGPGGLGARRGDAQRAHDVRW